jgi:hypothetical protein
MNLDNLITGLNQGDNKAVNRIRDMFGSLTKFVKYYVKKRKKLTEINLNSYWQQCNSDEERYFNTLCLDILNEAGPSYFIHYLSDVVYENETYYVTPWHLKDLSSLFLRNESEIVDSVFDSDNYEYFNIEPRYINYYYDIVNILNDRNKKYLKERILELTDGHTFSENDFENPPYDYFVEKEYFKISENIDDILKISDLFNEIMELEPLFNIKLEMENLYNYAYNESWGEVMFKRIFDSMSDIFYPEFTWESDKPKIRIVDFPGFLRTFFNCADEENIIDQYDFISFLYTIMGLGCIERPDFRTLDYPPTDKVDEYINDLFIDYLS